ncbi:NADH-quinone oxidoreductase subunit L [Exilibacterium tricleocarpae]|uniref:NADH-quinone oxidoreductase subunit L n=1 Tax=Exilibacterium tricleocarpae TaxID=2591008 RepID=A0A545T1V7_9GAMM|nr:NADH-quinone oxidoreductase subunit L [Exilibacterium tricleocarpae]TQV71179.1 NADH-quinone oxidoreductase subunit L [Exilibacterium tricleocarpae]
MDKLWLVPTFPLLGFVLLTLLPLWFGPLPRRLTALIGAGSIGLSALATLWIGQVFLASGLPDYNITLWQWLQVADLSVTFGFYLDSLTLTMMGVITGVGFLIHVYSVGFMREDPGYARFFSYMNLFVAAMLVLVMADNLVLLYLGWEGVGLCSYLLIGFWYQNPRNGYCARKAFVVTRVGDTAMAIGLFLLFKELGDLNIQSVNALAPTQWDTGGTLPTAIALLLLGGAVGKSAQLPLQTWLPDAMAGPTPISALIHAATMVTAGVYLIARTHPVFMLAPDALALVAIIGAATALIAGFTALTQTDIKRILAYSTVSQIGYMFLALGVGAWSGAIFHLMTHAFFKALLFLGAGTVILSLHHEHDIFKMGGMRRQLPLAFICFLIGSAALAALPLTSGYYSKHAIMLATWNAPGLGPTLWLVALAGAFMTALYSFRLVFVVFFGPPSEHHRDAAEQRGLTMAVPLAILGVLALIGGYAHLELDNLPATIAAPVPGSVDLLTIAVPFAGILLAYAGYGARWFDPQTLARNPLLKPLREFWYSGWGMDWLYDKLLVAPWKGIARFNSADVIDTVYSFIAWSNRGAHLLVSMTQTGKLRWYAATLALGTVLLLGYGLF